MSIRLTLIFKKAIWSTRTTQLSTEIGKLVDDLIISKVRNEKKPYS